jgi:hypothetical protein
VGCGPGIDGKRGQDRTSGGRLITSAEAAWARSSPSIALHWRRSMSNTDRTTLLRWVMALSARASLGHSTGGVFGAVVV